MEMYYNVVKVYTKLNICSIMHLNVFFISTGKDVNLTESSFSQSLNALYHIYMACWFIY